jgi:hypothetical protein
MGWLIALSVLQTAGIFLVVREISLIRLLLHEVNQRLGNSSN